MKIVKQSVEIINAPDYRDMLCKIEKAGRTCYKSENAITEESAVPFIASIIRRGHESVLEHGSLTFRITTNRGVSHQIVRHRLASYSQESTRYCNYSKDKFGKEIAVIEPLIAKASSAYDMWMYACETAEDMYFELLGSGVTPEIARGVLPHDLKTEIVVTMNIREIRHFIKERISPAAHPQIREVAEMMLDLLNRHYPVFVGDICAVDPGQQG